MMAGIMWPMQKHILTLRRLALLVALLASSAWAQTGPPPGLQPLYDRLAEIRREQQALSETIQSPSAVQPQKAQALTKYQALEAEKMAIQKEIGRVQKTGQSGFLKDGAPTEPSSPAPTPGSSR